MTTHFVWALMILFDTIFFLGVVWCIAPSLATSVAPVVLSISAGLDTLLFVLEKLARENG